MKGADASRGYGARRERLRLGNPGLTYVSRGSVSVPSPVRPSWRAQAEPT